MMARTSTLKRALVLALIVTLALLALAACSGDENDNGDANAVALTVRDAWVRATAPQDDGADGMDEGRAGSVTGAFMVIENPGDEAEYLVSVTVDESITTTVELHETTLDENDVMRMRPVEQIEVPAEGRAELQPGGYHIMLIDVQRALNPGDTVTLTLDFASGETITVEAAVREMDN